MNNADVNYNKITDLINSNNEKDLQVFQAAKNLNTEKNAVGYLQGDFSFIPTSKQIDGIITFEDIRMHLEGLFTSEEIKKII